jgi:hypothetical protein
MVSAVWVCGRGVGLRNIRASLHEGAKGVPAHSSEWLVGHNVTVTLCPLHDDQARTHQADG